MNWLKLFVKKSQFGRLEQLEWYWLSGRVISVSLLVWYLCIGTNIPPDEIFGTDSSSFIVISGSTFGWLTIDDWPLIVGFDSCVSVGVLLSVTLLNSDCSIFMLLTELGLVIDFVSLSFLQHAQTDSYHKYFYIMLNFNLKRDKNGDYVKARSKMSFSSEKDIQPYFPWQLPIQTNDLHVQLWSMLQHPGSSRSVLVSFTVSFLLGIKRYQLNPFNNCLQLTETLRKHKNKLWLRYSRKT